MIKRLFLVAMVTSLLGAAQFAAGQIPAAPPRATHGSPAEKAITAYRGGRPYSAAKLARPLAENGDPDALFLMALLLDSTREPLRLSRGQAMIHYYRLAETAGHPEATSRRQLTVMASGSKNERKAAIDSLTSAADQGDNRATRVLGEAWLRGFVDGKPDPAKAIQLWSKAADAGDASSLLLLGKLQSGNLTPSFKPDPAAAIESYRRAAATTDPDAYLPLGELLLTTQPDEGKAWLEKAIASDIPEAHRILGDHALATGKDHEAARNHYLKGAEAGSSPCMRRLANLLFSTPVSATDGLQWLHKAADQGDPRAAAELGHRLCDPASGAPDYLAARSYLTMAALEGVPGAQYDLAILHLEGRGTPEDPVAAVAWLSEAMKAGDAAIQFKLATLHEDGLGTPVNYANAGVLYTLAANKGHAAAAFRIARMTAAGLGTEASIPRAWAYANLAVERGNAEARDLLRDLDAKLDDTGRPAAAKALSELRTKAPASSSSNLPASP